MSLLTIENLTKSYGSVTALDRLSVTLDPGVIGLVGANGAGKSTLIKTLLGLLPATSGSAQVLGLDIATQGPAIRGIVGYMPEHDCLPPDVSATEFVVHMGKMSGLPMTAARERAADVLRHVGLYEERYRPIGGYSTGMRQRVKLAQALAHDPKLVLLDEPTNGLDPAGRNEMLGLIRRIGTEFGISVLVSSHLLGELEQICDHIIVVESGRLTRSTRTSDATAASSWLEIEVTDRAGEIAQVLSDTGHSVRAGQSSGHSSQLSPTRHLLVEVKDDTTYDLVRDTACSLEIGLVRMHRLRQHLTDLFQSPAAEAPTASVAGPPSPEKPHADPS
ncbi:MAG: type transport system ATP-binding protein [Actinomycetota bacterium]|nr:type transport system ATP-binding protein [Actinomycetota bacterium]